MDCQSSKLVETSTMHTEKSIETEKSIDTATVKTVENTKNKNTVRKRMQKAHKLEKSIFCNDFILIYYEEYFNELIVLIHNVKEKYENNKNKIKIDFDFDDEFLQMKKTISELKLRIDIINKNKDLIQLYSEIDGMMFNLTELADESGCSNYFDFNNSQMKEYFEYFEFLTTVKEKFDNYKNTNGDGEFNTKIGILTKRLREINIIFDKSIFDYIYSEY